MELHIKSPGAESDHDVQCTSIVKVRIFTATYFNHLRSMFRTTYHRLPLPGYIEHIYTPQVWLKNNGDAYSYHAVVEFLTGSGDLDAQMYMTSVRVRTGLICKDCDGLMYNAGVYPEEPDYPLYECVECGNIQNMDVYYTMNEAVWNVAKYTKVEPPHPNNVLRRTSSLNN